MDFNDYLFRSHMVGNIICSSNPLTENQKVKFAELHQRFIGNGKPLTANQDAEYISLRHKDNESKIIKFTDTAKNALADIVFYETTGRKNLLDTKYFKKGIICEKESRDLLSSVAGILFTKDDERKSNKWVTGKRDIKFDIILDIKNSFSLESFRKHLLESTNAIYLSQMDCYMELWDSKNSIICHCLIDTPIQLVNNEIRTLSYKVDLYNPGGDIYDDRIPEVKSVIQNHIFTRKGLEEYCQQSTNIFIEWFDDFKEIPKEQRVHMIEHPFSQDRIEQRNECIIKAREYMNTIKPTNKIINLKDYL